ncbi:MAG: aminodeoxychorismate synthase component I [Smithellaceae bacterium]
MSTNFTQTSRVVLRDEANGKWLEFTAPCRIVTTKQLDEVLPLIRRIEEAVRRDGLYAAGYISYEAAPAFDPALSVKDDGEFPLLWFGLFEQVKEITLQPTGKESGTSGQWQPTVTPAEYRRCLRKIRKFIVTGDTYQVNYTYRLRAKTEVAPWHIFLQIAGDEEAPFGAFVDTGEWAICSASPELFLKIDGDKIESRPMKGTAARGLWFEHDLAKKTTLRSSEKEQAENVMIVDMVRNDLGQIALCGSVQVDSLFAVEKYPSVWQMTSTVRARTREPLDRILQATFPPASITGAPKRRTMEIIAALESSPRRVYTGTIGFIAPGGRTQLNVAIRTVLLHKASGRAEYGVGGGIVWDSKTADEYQESLAKTKVLRASPRDFDLLETILWSPSGGCLLLGYHMKRLAQSADYFGFQVDLHQIQAELAKVAADLSSGLHKLRLLVSRLGTIRCEATPLATTALNFGDLVIAGSPIDAGDVFLYHKTTHRRVYEDAVRRYPGSNDILLLNEKGEITESTVANVAVEIDGVLYTPPVRCGLLPGTQRSWMLDQARLQERVISVQEALCSPKVFLLNSVRGMHQVRIRAAGQ